MAGDPLARYLEKRTRRRFAALVSATRLEVLNAAYRVLGDRDLAEDVTQEVFVKLLTVKWDSAKIRSGRGLLVSTAVLAARARLRSESRRREREKQAAQSETLPRGHDPHAELLRQVQEAVTELPDDLRPCVELRYFGGLSLEEAASSLGLGLTTLKGRLKEAREILRQKLAPLSGAFILPFLSGESDAAVPTIRVSASLEEKLKFLQRDGTAAARLAAGGAISSARAVRFAAAAALVAATAGWLFVGGPSRREEVQAPAVATARVEARVPAGRPQEVPPSNPGGAGLEEESAPAVKTAVEMKPYRVLDKEGKPIPGARLAIIAQEAIRFEGESDAEGSFDLPESLFEARAEFGSYGSLKSKKEGFYSTTRVLLNRPAPGYELLMERAREVTIRVLRGMDRMPVTRYAVRYDPVLNEYRSSEEGPFKDPPLEVEVEDPEGTFRFTPTNHFWRENVTVTVEGHDPLPGRQFVNLESYQQNELVFLLQSPGELWGWVVDPAGQPLAGAEVYTSNRRQPMPVLKVFRLDGGPAVAPSRFFLDRDPRVLTVRSEPPGSTHLEKLPPGLYQVTASKRGFRNATARVEVVPEKLVRVEVLLSR